MNVNMTSTQKFTAVIEVLNAAGGPAAFDGTPTWSVSDPLGLKLIVAADGLSAEVFALGPKGAFSLTVELDSDLSEDGVRTISGTLDVTIAPTPVDEAVEIRFIAPSPVEQ